MKLVIALAFAAVGYATMTTTNDCDADGEGAENLGSCKSLWYSMCNSYTLFAGASCNIVTWGDASLNWYSNDIQVSYWNLVETDLPEVDPNAEPDINAWERMRLMAGTEARPKCQPESLASQKFVSD